MNLPTNHRNSLHYSRLLHAKATSSQQRCCHRWSEALMAFQEIICLITHYRVRLITHYRLTRTDERAFSMRSYFRANWSLTWDGEKGEIVVNWILTALGCGPDPAVCEVSFSGQWVPHGIVPSTGDAKRRSRIEGFISEWEYFLSDRFKRGKRKERNWKEGDE